MRPVQMHYRTMINLTGIAYKPYKAVLVAAEANET